MKRENIAELKTLLDYSSDALLIADSEGKILYVTPSIERISGLKVKTHLGRNIGELVHEKLISHSATLEALNNGKTITCKVKTIAGKHQLNTALPVLDSSGKLKRIVCNIRSHALYQYQEEEVPAYLQAQDNCSLEQGYPYRLIQIGDHDIVVESNKMTAVVEMAQQVGLVDSTVIVYGETGVGKELIARLIHSRSHRAKTGSFIKINCASFSQSLIEAELFGYEAGAFTGALRSGKSGYFELANVGTLFLDEIAELSLEVQAKLLGVLQDRELYRVGGTNPKKIDTRIIAATNRNLEQMVKDGLFREDLFYRLNVIPIEVPPLRERKKDIPALILHFSRKLQEQYFFKKEISPDLIECLTRYPWPGNVRELFNLIERLLVTVPQKDITTAHLSGPYLSGSSSTSLNIIEKSGSLKEILGSVEMAVVKKTIEECRNQDEAAEMLGISLSSLTRRLRKLNNGK
ncbi:MAG: sigma 54-interacting transcriptional regulator [Bacillota bacterium]|nr:sigma 54-interacting transcriptional regulator [Bacillota bacterium]